MSKFHLFSLVALSLILFSACKPQAENVTPDGARQILQLRGYEINSKGYFKAIQAEDLAAIRTFFQAGIDPNMLNEKGETPLTFAVGCCEIKTVRALLEKVDIDGRNKEGNTALFLALRTDKRNVFDLLWEKNADIKIPGKNNRTILHVAASQDDLDLIQKLIERGADVNAVDDIEKDTPFIESCIGNSPHLEIVKFFLDKGVDINRQGTNKATCLIYVAAAGHKEVVRELLNRGANPKLKDREGKTALDWALKYDRKEVAALLKGK
jgi:ankyrin repeat protein